MKYMSFNNACFYAALANLLEEYSINIEDREILFQSDASKIITYSSEFNQFEAGYQIQDKDVINKFLSNFNLSFHEILFHDKKKAITFLKKEKGSYVIPLLLLEGKGKHAVIFKKYVDGVFHFINMVRKGEDEILSFDDKELFDLLDDSVRLGNIKSGSSTFQTLVDHSDIYIHELKDLFNKKLSFQKRMEIRETHFRALFISVYDLMYISGNPLFKRLDIERRKYMKTFEIKEEIFLGDYCDQDEIVSIIKEWLKKTE